VKVFETEVA